MIPSIFLDLQNSARSYSEQEKTQKSPHRRRCIDGSITGSGKCVGYCSFVEHPGYLTKGIRKKHNCIKKDCRYYSAKEKRKEESPANPFSALLSQLSFSKTSSCE